MNESIQSHKLGNTPSLNLSLKKIHYQDFSPQVLMLVLLIAMRNRIKLVIALFTEAGKAVGSMPLLLFQPVWVSEPPPPVPLLHGLNSFLK